MIDARDLNYHKRIITKKILYFFSEIGI